MIAGPHFRVKDDVSRGLVPVAASLVLMGLEFRVRVRLIAIKAKHPRMGECAGMSPELASAEMPSQGSRARPQLVAKAERSGTRSWLCQVIGPSRVTSARVAEFFSPRLGGVAGRGSSSPKPGWRKSWDGLWYPPGPKCDCDATAVTGRELPIHVGAQDTEGEAWSLLTRLIDEAAADGRERFSPGADLPVHLWPEIVTLPAAISKLTAVREFDLYGSHLIALPPEIGAMSTLRFFDPYTSRRLHWFPYEITRCTALTDSRVSTRHLYGNYKNRLPFPRLPAKLPTGSQPRQCSVCDGPFPEVGPIQRWISLWIATDVLPLLVHACSDRCIDALPRPPSEYVEHPHEGGRALLQPPPSAPYA